MKITVKRYVLTLVTCTILLASTFSQTVIWNEDFTGYADRVIIGQDNNLPVGADWTSTATDCDGGGSITGTTWTGSDWWGTTVGGQFRANDIEGGPCTCGNGGTTNNFILTETIDISGFFSVGFTVDISSTGSMEAGPLNVCDNSGDNVRVTYSIDGGPFIQAPTNGFLSGNFTPNPITAATTCLNGSTLVIQIQAGNKANDEHFLIDNINVTGFTTPLIANAGIDDTICAGDNIILNATGGGTYTWNANPALSCLNCQSPTATPILTQNFIVSVNQNGCTDQDTVRISVINPPINLDLGNDTIVCNGPINILLDATQVGTTNYLWQDFSTNSTLNVTTAGTYHVQVSNICNSDADTIVVQLNNTPTVNLGNDTTVCTAAINFTLDATTTGVNYQWQNLSTNPTFNVTTPGTYFVTVSNICGSFTDTVHVNLLPALSLNLGNDTIVCGGPINIILDATQTSPVNYLWQDMSTNATFNVTTPGTYSVQVSNACTTLNDNITVQLNNVPAVNIGNDTSVCPGAFNILLDATTAGVTYQWQNLSTNPTFNATTVGTYYVMVTNVCGSFTDTLHITSLNNPVVNLGNDTLVCGGPINILLDAFNSGATYLWQDASTNSTFNVNTAGQYYVAVTNTCATVTDTINVQLLNIPVADLGNDVSLCAGSINFILDQTQPNVNYLWQDMSTNATFNVTNPGIYIVGISNACGVDIDSMTVIELQPPVVNLGNDTLICTSPFNLLLNAFNPSSTYLWQNASTNSSLNATSTGTYFVTVTNSCGAVTDSINIVGGTIATVNLGTDVVLCTGDQIQLDATINNGISYLWQDGSTNSIFNVTVPGIYHVAVTSACNIAHDTIEILPQLQITDVLSDFVADCFEDSMFIDISNIYPGITGIWSNGETGSSTFITETGEHYFSFDYCNEDYTDSFTVTLKNPQQEEIFMPNAFTPNLDEVNPVYKIYGEFTTATSFSIIIFNRWGQEIFSSDDPDFIWDGTYQGVALPVGSYYARVEMTRECNPEIFKTGTVINLLR